ncbi:hypothetical protein AB8Z38_07285 [Bradyrhizobium sp. LLZ17]|uniref:ABC transporter substrate-binding protein n=1 Tax=Bradyrhizobium sp. LLZ17 TaxID=3239388 RepID=A0AB39XRA3_9BRAD
MGGNAANQIIIISSDAPFTYTRGYETIVEGKFGPKTPVPEKLLVPTLEQTAAMVEQAINAVDKLANP